MGRAPSSIVTTEAPASVAPAHGSGLSNRRAGDARLCRERWRVATTAVTPLALVHARRLPAAAVSSDGAGSDPFDVPIRRTQSGAPIQLATQQTSRTYEDRKAALHVHVCGLAG
jgi:hypothetical protein